MEKTLLDPFEINPLEAELSIDVELEEPVEERPLPPQRGPRVWASEE